jgi:hypothetical protein
MISFKNYVFSAAMVLAFVPVKAQSLQSLQAQIKSMEACRISIKHVDCNLQILDTDIRQTLIQLDQLNQQRAQRTGQSSAPIGVTANVQFFTSSISEVNNEVLRMSNSSVWILERNYFGLAFQDVIGVMIDQKNAILYANDSSYRARLVRGQVLTSSGSTTSVIESKGSGAILKLSNGMLLEFDSYDRYDTGWWLPPYPVLLDESKMNMWNLNKGKKVWIKSIL